MNGTQAGHSEPEDQKPEGLGAAPVRRRTRAPLVALAVVVVAALIATGVALSLRPTALERAYDACLGEDETVLGIRMLDDGSTLHVDTVGNDDAFGADYADAACLLNELDTRQRMISLMDSTRALDGRQSDTWDDFTATWSYHPDSGMDLLVVED